MRELIEIDSSATHECSAPQVERWHVLEPISGRWLWLKVYACCGQILEEPVMAQQQPASDEGVRKAA